MNCMANNIFLRSQNMDTSGGRCPWGGWEKGKAADPGSQRWHKNKLKSHLTAMNLFVDPRTRKRTSARGGKDNRERAKKADQWVNQELRKLHKIATREANRRKRCSIPFCPFRDSLPDGNRARTDVLFTNANPECSSTMNLHAEGEAL